MWFNTAVTPPLSPRAGAGGDTNASVGTTATISAHVLQIRVLYKLPSQDVFKKHLTEVVSLLVQA